MKIPRFQVFSLTLSSSKVFIDIYFGFLVDMRFVIFSLILNEYQLLTILNNKIVVNKTFRKNNIIISINLVLSNNHLTFKTNFCKPIVYWWDLQLSPYSSCTLHIRSKLVLMILFTKLLLNKAYSSSIPVDD